MYVHGERERPACNTCAMQFDIPTEEKKPKQKPIAKNKNCQKNLFSEEKQSFFETRKCKQDQHVHLSEQKGNMTSFW
jgi:hypothetical protein